LPEQLTLEPFLPGGFMEAWIEWVKSRSPDYAEKKLDAWKIIGSALLNTLAKTIADIDPIASGNMIIALTGPSGSIKSWALQTARHATPNLTIEAGTPEYLVSRIEKKRVGIVYEVEVASVMKQADRQGYMRTWGELLDKAYGLEALEAGRKRAKSAFVEDRGYYISFMIAGTTRDYAGMLTLWPGLKRRIFFLDMEEVAPLEVWKPGSKGAEALAKLHLIGDALKEVIVILSLKNHEAVKEEIKRGVEKVKDQLTRRRQFEYAFKMLYATIVDRALPLILRSTPLAQALSVASASAEREGVDVREIGIDNVTRSPTSTLSLTDDISYPLSSFRVLINSCGAKRVSVVSVDCRQLLTDARLLCRLLNRQLPTLPTLEAGDRRYVEFVEDVKELLREGGGYTTLREVCRRRNWTKQDALRYLESMEEAGIAVRRFIGRTLHVLSAELKVCGTCAKFSTPQCPLGRTCEKLEEELLFEEPCENYVSVAEVG
jgi:hypothetical protein